ncbi:MAG TPA: ATP-binding protein, partial [Permianibacter sp.]|nr:ATP-binding protein [Permianibacter sp.]
LVQDVRPLLTSVCETNQPLGLTKQVQLNATIPDTPLIAKVDSSRLQQVLTNLIANAIKFSPEHSTVQLTARRDGDLLEVTVRDQGPGIPEAFKAHLFEQFAQADAGDNRQHAGTGLGLAISKALIEQMRGEIGYRTPSGPGAEFFVRLPLSSPETD